MAESDPRKPSTLTFEEFDRLMLARENEQQQNAPELMTPPMIDVQSRRGGLLMQPPEVATGVRRAQGVPEKVQEFGKTSALPVVGGLAGQAIGRRIAGTPGGLLLEGVGSAAGEGVNQLTGITEPSAGQLATQFFAPFVGRAAGSVIGKTGAAIMRKAPGAAKVLQEEAAKTVRGIPAKYAGPAGQAQILYKQLEKLNPRIPTPNLRNAVNELLQKELETPDKLQGPLRPVTESLTEFLNQHGGDVPFRQLRATLQRIGQRTGSVQGLEANEVRAGFKFLDKAIQDDLEAAVTGGKIASRTAASLLKQANKAYARGKSVEELSEILEGSVNKGRSDLLESVNPARAIKAIKESPTLAKSFTPAELADITKILTRLRSLPTLPPPGGESAIGTGRILARLLAGGALGGGLAGSAGGGPLLTAAGTAVGVGAAQAVHGVTANLLSTAAGRRFLLRVVTKKNGLLDQAVWPLMLQVAAAQFAERPSRETSRGMSEANRSQGLHTLGR